MFYVWKVLLILLFLVVSAWMPLFQTPQEFSDRMATVLTLFLAAVAFLFVVNDALPKISYLTVLDRVMLFAFTTIFLAGVESFIVFLVYDHGKSKIADRIDMVTQILYPVVFILGLVRIVYTPISARVGLISDPTKQWVLVRDSADSPIKPMPGEEDPSTQFKLSRQNTRRQSFVDALRGETVAREAQDDDIEEEKKSDKRGSQFRGQNPMSSVVKTSEDELE